MKIVSIVLIAVGIILIVYGANASHSVSSDVSRAVNGTPTDKTMWLLVGGIAAALLGILGLASGRSK